MGTPRLTIFDFNRDRVVCVMTTGQEWQFKPYKWTEPKELFHHGTSAHPCRDEGLKGFVLMRLLEYAVKGVFVQWNSDAPNTKVRSWNVTELRVDRKSVV